MKLTRYFGDGKVIPGLLLDDDTVADCSELRTDWGQGFFMNNGTERVRNWIEQRNNPNKIPHNSLKAAPAAMRPPNLYCVLSNYPATANEQSEPIIYNVSTSAWCGPNERIELLPENTNLDWSVELALVIGQETYQVEASQAFSRIGGFGIISHLRQINADGSAGSYPLYSAFGPALLTPDELSGENPLELTSSLNGENTCQTSTSEMILNPVELVHRLAREVKLLPGDVISTGSPTITVSHQLNSGDFIENEITGMGKQQMMVQIS